MKEKIKEKLEIFKVGRRTIKTVVSVLLILLLYSISDRNACFACIGAVFGMGNMFKGGVKSGGNRFLGTVIGGLLAIPFYPLYHNPPFSIPSIIWLTLGLFLTLYVHQLFGCYNAIQPGTVVYFVVILTVSQDRFITYTIARMIDTGVGVLMSLFINKLFPPPLDKEKSLETIS